MSLGGGLDGSLDGAFGMGLMWLLFVVLVVSVVLAVLMTPLLARQSGDDDDGGLFGDGDGGGDELVVVVGDLAPDIAALLTGALDGAPLVALPPLLVVEQVARPRCRDGSRRPTLRETLAGLPDEVSAADIGEQSTQMTQAIAFPASQPSLPEPLPVEEATEEPAGKDQPQPRQRTASVISSPYGLFVEMRPDSTDLMARWSLN